jgi:hypothetical protein
LIFFCAPSSPLPAGEPAEELGFAFANTIGALDIVAEELVSVPNKFA